MKTCTRKLAVITLAVWLSGVCAPTFAAYYHHRHDNPKPEPVEPPTVTSVDPSAMTVTIRTGKSSTDVYKLTKLTTILIDGKPGTIDGIQKGMKANVTGSASNLSKIELTTVQVGNTEEPRPKKNK